MANPLEKLKSWGEKTWQRNVVDPLQAAGNSIDKAVVRPTTNALGLTTEATPDAAKVKIDPARAQGMANYGQMVTTQAGQFDPKAYGPNTFQARTVTPQITSNTGNMPGIYSPAAQTPQVPGQVAAPNLQNVSGQAPALRNITTGNMANTFKQEGALADELSRLSAPTNMTVGYDQNLRDTFISNATSGLDKQKQDAVARLKEEQMKAGNYGSSVGQKQTAELMAEYDRQVAQAGQQADLMQMEAAREDRYRNVGVDQSRTGLLANVAGAGANLNLASTGFNRDTTSMQNQIEQIKADYARQGIQIDNDTAMAMANFSSGQNQQQFGNQMARADMTNAQNLTGYNSQWNRYNAQTDEKQRADQLTNVATEGNIARADAADVRNYGVYQDATQGLAAYGANTADPQSILNNQEYLRQQAEKQQRLGTTLNTIGMFLPGGK
jgi:hypothetical protein